MVNIHMSGLSEPLHKLFIRAELYVYIGSTLPKKGKISSTLSHNLIQIYQKYF